MYRLILIVIFFTLSFINFSKANFDVKARTAILQDYHSGEILYEKEADISIYPASMTKIMTAIIAFDLIKSGDLNLDEKFIISEKLGDYQHLVIHQCLLWSVMKSQQRIC